MRRAFLFSPFCGGGGSRTEVASRRVRSSKACRSRHRRCGKTRRDNPRSKKNSVRISRTLSKSPHSVEVAGTEPTLLIPLTLLLFQTLICQVVSDFNHLTAISLSKLHLYYIQNSRFNLFTVLSDTSVSLATFRIG